MLHQRWRHATPRGAHHRRYRARTMRTPICPVRRSEEPSRLTLDQARHLVTAEQAAYDAHLAAYHAWHADPDSPAKQAALTAAYRAWQSARQACLGARLRQPRLFANFRS